MIEDHFALTSPNALLKNSQNPTISSLSNQNFDLWFLFAQAQNFLQEDIVARLEQGRRAEAIEEYLQNANQLLLGFSYHQPLLESQIQTTKSRISICESQLNQANLSYRDSLKTYDEPQFQRAISDAQNARSCLGIEQVNYASNRELLARLEQYQKILQRRADYFQENKRLIIDHYDILKPQLLSRLQAIVSTLQIKE